MVEERIKIQATPERIKTEERNLRRNSTGKKSINSEEKILPHYLRASTSSCHDFCKYGRKHAFAEKKKSPIPKGITTKQDEDHDLMKNQNLVLRKKKSEVMLNPSPVPKPQMPESDKPEIVKRNIAEKNQNLVLRKKKSEVRLNPSPVPKPQMPESDKSEIVMRNISEKKTLPSKQALSPVKKTNLLTKKISSPAMNTNLPVKKASLPSKKTVPSPKPVSDSKLRPMSANSSGGLIVRKNSDPKMVKKKALVPPKASLSPQPHVKRVLSINSRQHKNIKTLSPLKNRIKMRKPEPKLPNHSNVEEKILYIVEQKPESGNEETIPNGIHFNQFSPSPSSSISSTPQCFPPLPLHIEEHHEEFGTVGEKDDSISEYEETENEGEIETFEVEKDRRPRRNATRHQGDKELPPQKLNFRKGKVISLQSETNSPRRLKFRQGKVLGENHIRKGDTGRRSFKRRIIGNDLKGTKSESEKVVLRHQDVQGKKDDQGLFNDVIEETASKLVETRKSKVKALVGAFETVISLQERKPTSPKSG